MGVLQKALVLPSRDILLDIDRTEVPPTKWGCWALWLDGSMTENERLKRKKHWEMERQVTKSSKRRYRGEMQRDVEELPQRRK